MECIILFFCSVSVFILTVQTNLKLAAKLVQLTPDATKNEKQKMHKFLAREIIVQL